MRSQVVKSKGRATDLGLGANVPSHTSKVKVIAELLKIRHATFKKENVNESLESH